LYPADVGKRSAFADASVYVETVADQSAARHDRPFGRIRTGGERR
jgi:hypothetical protein